MGLNPPRQSQHNEGVGGCNEGNPDAAIRRLGVNHNEGGTSNRNKIGEEWFHRKRRAATTARNSL